MVQEVPSWSVPHTGARSLKCIVLLITDSPSYRREGLLEFLTWAVMHKEPVRACTEGMG